MAKSFQNSHFLPKPNKLNVSAAVCGYIRGLFASPKNSKISNDGVSSVLKVYCMQIYGLTWVSRFGVILLHIQIISIRLKSSDDNAQYANLFNPILI